MCTQALAVAAHADESSRFESQEHVRSQRGLGSVMTGLRPLPYDDGFIRRRR